ncbi:BRCA2-interacting transcriptional repressor EMSY [Episyrphus balteatus]|uniref:BRCA2-interacting transcriptional repressor EMSY n=1 Tax=Episyrphus balteatus TaxID=286459 RepID=UPI002485EA93|nr:BRCA2-interacting transcriptional repressor EMSY [Episyrphus balteatus]
MWPTALQLTRDECRGILRRLELESYANVISVFRAQGGLTDTKSKLLEDLRNVFHISQERHRAEARRVANDEQLSTIAEAISGPNTYQEWSREGRRPYPLLPRVPPQTALCVVANHVAAEVTNENSQLPYPSETGNLQQTKQELNPERLSESSCVPIVTSDPFQPEIPDIRKTLKRNLPTEAPSSTKKRIVSEISPSATTGEPPLSPATQIRKLYHNHSKTQSTKKNTPAKKSTNSPMKRPTAASAKKRLISGETVDSNKANNVVVVSTAANQSQSSSAALCSTASTAANIEVIPPPPLLPPTPSLSSASSVTSPEIINELQQTSATTPTTTITTPSIPQIATSKKDISKNLSKLNLITNQPVLQQSDKLPECKTEKLSTPVQKYIVDNRTPMLPTQFLDKQQVITTKLKPMTTIVPTQLSTSSKAKVTSVKTIKSGDILCSTPVSSQPQVFNIIDASSPPYLPHTPPAIINISSKFEPEHGKVLKTKLLPLMLSSGSKIEPNNVNFSPMKSSSSPAGTVFRKPNIIKPMPTTIKPKIHITNQQIISPPTVASLKMSPHLHLKGVPGGGPIHNRNSVKIFSSSNGKMFIQSADSSAKQMTKVNTIVSSQKGLVNTSTPPGRIAIQKVHIIPAPGTVASSSGTTLGNVTIPKSMAITKPNMIIMPMTGQQTMKGLPIVKSNKFSAVLPTQMAVQETAATNPKSNVIVIGSVPSMSQTILPKEMQGFSNRNSMITEDTPVDIITTPIIVNVDSIGSQSLKPTETIDLTTMADSHSNSPTQSKKAAAAVALLQPNRLTSETSYVESSSGGKIESDASPIKEQQQQESMVIGVTDWEMELDQEASKTRAINAEKIRRRNSVENMVIGSGAEDDGSSDEHFVEDDVIEEHEETEEEMEIAAGMERDKRDRKREREMTEKKRQEELEAHRQHHQYDEDEEETIEVGDEQMKSSEGDVIQYDESYESVNEELDESITIEYVEDEQDGYEEKINSTSSDQKDTTTENIKQSTAANPLADDQTQAEPSENKSQNDSTMVSVEEISSTTQQNISSSKSDH